MTYSTKLTFNRLNTQADHERDVSLTVALYHAGYLHHSLPAHHGKHSIVCRQCGERIGLMDAGEAWRLLEYATLKPADSEETP